LPNVFTVVADVSAAFLLVSGGPQPLSRLLCVVAAGVALYWAGMVLNDVFDVEQDRRERPSRPIPGGWIPLPQARMAGWSLWCGGIVLAAASGLLPGEPARPIWLPAAVGIALAVMIVAYDGPLKHTPLAPAAMGSCRVLSFLLGAAPCVEPAAGSPLFPMHVVGAALGFGVYVMGITTMARREAAGGRSPNLPTGLLVTITGAAMLAFAPQLAPPGMPWHVAPARVFPLMIGIIACPVVLRGFRAVGDPTPARIQTAIRVGILTIIPLAASFAVLGAGPEWGVAVFLLTAPSIMLSVQFRVT
jgi:4-hydroxybenzoate polyprenyltransferase